MAAGLAFYDFDGTLVSSNVVTQYAWYARRSKPARAAVWRIVKLAAGVPALIAVDLYSRRRFNEVIYHCYRGMGEEWLREQAESLFESVIRPAIHAGAGPLVERDRAEGFVTVLVTGSPDFAVAPAARWFGFHRVIANRLVFANGVATGEIAPPLIAEREKVEAMRRLAREYNVGTEHCKAYTDSISDLPMLEAVGRPAAANPERRLRRVALQRGWPVIDLKAGNHVHTS